jgi:type II secretory pathway pseudopilin PulG
MGVFLQKKTRGFTTVEMVVSIGMFTTLTLIISGAFLSVTDAARKARATRIAVDNVSSALDYMAREIRLGLYFRCENDTVSPIGPTTPLDTPLACPFSGTGGNVLTFERAGGSLLVTSDQMVFWHESGRLWRSTNGGVTKEALTAPELDISDFRFYVDGVAYSVAGSPADQPRITLIVRGIANGNNTRVRVPFSIQTTLSVRSPNIPPT